MMSKMSTFQRGHSNCRHSFNINTIIPAKFVKQHVSHQINAFFFISILFISIIRLESGKNKHNLSITKAQVLAHDEGKNEEYQS